MRRRVAAVASCQNSLNYRIRRARPLAAGYFAQSQFAWIEASLVQRPQAAAGDAAPHQAPALWWPTPPAPRPACAAALLPDVCCGRDACSSALAAVNHGLPVVLGVVAAQHCSCESDAAPGAYARRSVMQRTLDVTCIHERRYRVSLFPALRKYALAMTICHVPALQQITQSARTTAAGTM